MEPGGRKLHILFGHSAVISRPHAPFFQAPVDGRRTEFSQGNTSATISMSTLPPNPPTFGSSWLAFLRRDPPPIKPAAAAPFLRIPELVAAYAAQSPQLPAVVAGHETLSYGDLESQSNALARHLLSLGSVPETLIAVFLPRSPSAVVAALAIMKTGAAYLPPDHSCPGERIRL